MKRFVCCALLLAVLPLAGRAAEEVDVEEIKQRVLEELKPVIEAEVQRRVQEELAKREAVGKAAETAATTPAVAQPGQPWSPAQSITLLRAGSAYMNISFDTLVDFGWSTTPDVRSIQFGDHDPSQRGFTMPNSEFVFEGAVDPYFRGLGDVVLKLDGESETTIELEEAYLETTSLAWNLQVRAGHWFSEFGRQNPQHPHAWDFVDQPLVLGRMFGPEGMRNPGARVSWLLPTPFYAELLLTVLNGNGEITWSFRNPESEEFHGGEVVDRHLRGPQDLVYLPRLATAFDLSETQTLLLGAAAATGPNNTGADACTQIVGGDVTWKWRPEDAERGFPFVKVQSEAMYRWYEAAERVSVDDPLVTLPEETLGDWGFYTQVLYGFCPGLVAGLRGEFVSADDAAFDSDLRLDRTRISPNLTWYPTEFSKIRLQYNYDHIQQWGDEHSVWMQLEFLLGSHGAHKF